jgi:putative Mg2+ transporter-C (MgtC) family protein
MEGVGLAAAFDVAQLRLDLLGRLVLAASLGGVVGLEREISGKPAGLRTNLLICVGAALLTDLSITISRMAGPLVVTDPARIAAQIVSGVGFLGAGTIIQARGSVLGLTTAATLWVVAAIGMAVGASAYVEAIGTTILVIGALFVLGHIENRHLRRGGQHVLQITIVGDHHQVSHLEAALADAGLEVHGIDLEWDGATVQVSLQATGSETSWTRAMDRLTSWPGIRRVSRT